MNLVKGCGLIWLCCALPLYAQDDDEPIAVTGYFGTAVDSFAAQDLKDYLNPEDSGETSAFERSIFGIDFEAQLTKKIYIFGETLHGVRSADINCEEKPDLCDEISAEPGADEPLAILKSATSLEAFAGIRAHISSLKEGDLDLYVKAQAGFVTVSDNGGDIFDDHHIGLGIMTNRGQFEGSYFEVGYGKSDYFLINNNRRFKIDGFVSIALNENQTASFFAQMVVNADLSDGSDSIQSFFGVDFDIGHFLRKRFAEEPEEEEEEGTESDDSEDDN
jgi:hypothetical protein